jgi:iron complex outermembrane receptor protein
MKLSHSLIPILAWAPLAKGQLASVASEETVVVSGARKTLDTFTGVLGSKPLTETPFSIQVFDSDRMGADVTANQVLRRDPALTNVATTGGFSAFNLGFRGFPSGADAISFYGMGPGAMFSGSLGQLYSVDRLEVIKGPSAGLGSFSPNAAVGGAINIVPKLPFQDNRTTLTLGAREFGIVGGHMDVNRSLSDRTAVRLNLASESGKTFYEGRDERDVLALSLRHQLSESTELILGYDQMRVRSEGYQNAFVLASGVPVPKAPNPSRNHFQKWTWLEQEWNYGYGSLEWKFAPDWKLFVQGLYGIRRRPILSSGTGLIRSEDGDMLLRPNYFAEGTRYKPFFGGNLFLSHKLKTGPWTHHLTLASLQNGFIFITAEGASLAPIPSNLYHPIYTERPALDVTGRDRSSEVHAITQAFSDDIQLNDQWNLLLGIKDSLLCSDSYNVTSGEKTLHRKDKGTTPFGALSYKLSPRMLSYLSYAKGLERGGVAPAAAANADAIMPPVHNHQVELGLKSSEVSGLFLTAALFEIRRGLEYLDADSNVYLQNGLQRNRGLELNASGLIHDRVTLQAGLLLLDAKIVRVEALRNKSAPGAPNLTLPLTLDYQWNENWNVSGSLYHFGKQSVDAVNTRELKPWTRVDAGLKYATRVRERPFFVQALVENIGQQRYWASAAGGQLVLGPPEIWKLALRTEI